MKHLKATILLLVLSLMTAPFLWSYGKDYVVVVNPADAQLKVDTNQLQLIFLGETTKWPDGRQIEVAALKNGSHHKAFMKEMVRLTPVKFAIHWKRKVFTGTGTGTSIKFFKTDEEIKAYVAATPGSIGYIAPKSLDDTVMRLKVSEK